MQFVSAREREPMMRSYFFKKKGINELQRQAMVIKCINRSPVIKVCTHRCSRGFPLKGIPAFQRKEHKEAG